MKNGFLLALSALAATLVAALGVPFWCTPLGPLAAMGAYALFWKVQWTINNRRLQFLLATLWFATTHLVQSSFLTAYDYQGYYIFFIWSGLSLFFGLHFALLSLLVTPSRITSILNCAGLASLWVLAEWSRLFILTGFPWTNVGFHLAANSNTLILASVGGIFGLAFLVMFTNLLVLRAWQANWTRRPLTLAIATVLVPYALGWGHIQFYDEPDPDTSRKVTALLVQTGTPPREIIAQEGVSLVQQGFDRWRDAIAGLENHQSASVDLIVIPEGFVAFGPDVRAYPIELVHKILLAAFGPAAESALPPTKSERVGNGYIAQAIANIFNAQVVVGLDACEGECAYNAALRFTPHGSTPDFYAKQILLPMAEYIPWDWAKDLAARYGIAGSFTPGEGPKVFRGGECPPYSLSICSEEAYGNLVREGRQLGAEMLVTIANDAWYPRSRLPILHFEHGRLRAVENGAPLLRACSTGVTGAIDAMGRTISVFGNSNGPYEFTGGVLKATVSRHHYATIYSRFGDAPIIIISLLFAGVLIARLLFREKRKFKK